MNDYWTDCYEPTLLSEWQPLRPATANLNHWVRSTDRSFARNFARLLRRTGIIASEWAACRVLYHPGGMSPLAVAAAIGMTKGGASKLVSRLVRKGLARKDIGYSDRRFRSVRLTGKGRDLVVFMASLERQADMEFSSPLGNNRRFRLTQYMRRMHGKGRSDHMYEWITHQLENTELKRFEPAKTKSVPKWHAEEDADVVWS